MVIRASKEACKDFTDRESTQRAHLGEQANKQTSKQAGKQASRQASMQARKQVSTLSTFSWSHALEGLLKSFC